MSNKSCRRCGSTELRSLSKQREDETTKKLLECTKCGHLTEVVTFNRPVLVTQS